MDDRRAEEEALRYWAEPAHDELRFLIDALDRLRTRPHLDAGAGMLVAAVAARKAARRLVGELSVVPEEIGAEALLLTGRLEWVTQMLAAAVVERASVPPPPAVESAALVVHALTGQAA